MATSNGFLGCSGGSEEKQREVGIKRLESHVPGACRTVGNGKDGCCCCWKCVVGVWRRANANTANIG